MNGNFSRKRKRKPAIVGSVLLAVGTAFCSCSADGNRFVSAHLEETAIATQVPEGFVTESATTPGLVTYPTFATFDNDGRLFVIESSGQTTSTEDVLMNPTFRIVLLEDEDDDGVFDKRSVFADKLPYPMGGTFYRGSFYATVPPDVIRFTDTNGDNTADEREVILTGWTLNHNAATLSGPFFGPDGWMYMCDARRGFNITTKEGNVLQGKGARIWRCRPDGSGLEWISGGGFDNTIEMVFMPSGETIGTMTYFTDPQDGLRDALMHWVEGGVYPKPYPVIAEDKLKLTGDLMPVMTKLARVSPAGLMRYRGTAFGEEYQGNLFSAQFNTGRIMRHVVRTDGATYRTTDEPFLTMDNLELHPTDVLEDADGSLLVVNTGGWFIAGCPLSVTAKTDVQGSIIRIRKTDAPKVRDPRGKEINFEQLSAERLSVFLDDARPVVRDRAMERMIALGDASTDYFIDMLRSSDREEARAAAVFALYRQGTEDALKAALLALDDTSSIVRTASARVMGLAKYKPAVEVLSQALSDHSLNVRRQAATALGQIGDPSAVIPLLKAAEFRGDRFTDHAITHSIISLRQAEPVLMALKHPDDGVRRTALIALDQMDGSPIEKKHVIPFLESSDSLLQQTGIWVVSHHTEWSDAVVTFLERYFKTNALTDVEEKTVKELLTTFADQPAVNMFVSAKLKSSATPTDLKLLLLDVIAVRAGDLNQKDFVLLKDLLRSPNRALQAGVLDLIQSRGFGGFDKALNELIWDAGAIGTFRLQALRARLTSEPQLSDREFNLLLQFVSPKADAQIRRTAGALLAQAKLSDARLLTLANDYVPETDEFLISGLLDAFADKNNEHVGMALVKALQRSPDRLENISLEHFDRIFKMYPARVRESAETLRSALQERHASRLSALEQVQAKLGHGDVGEGRRLFFGKALCSTCHSVANNGEVFGPDLTNIGEIRSQHDILEAILYPGASLAREYETSIVRTKQTTYTGIIKGQSPETIAIETGPGIVVRVPRHEVEAIESQDVSMMPPGLDKQLSTQELSDLMAYLTTLPDGMGHLRVAR